MTQREQATELVELVCKALGTSLSNYMAATKEGAISEVEYWLRDHSSELDEDW